MTAFHGRLFQMCADASEMFFYFYFFFLREAGRFDNVLDE